MAALEAAEDFQAAISRLTRVTEELVGSGAACLDNLSLMESTFGEAIASLQRDKEHAEFAARHRDFVSQFEERVFRRFRLSARYQEARDAGAEPLASKGATLQLLASLTAAAEDEEDEDGVAFLKPGNLLLMEAWDDAVRAKGLEVDEYQALRALGDTAHASSHRQLSAREALVQLESSLPEGFAAYRQPLAKLLSLLAGPA